MPLLEIVLGTTTLFCALLAGFFFSYTISVNPGLRKLDDASYLSAMQQINRAVLNPLFLICFFGANLLLVMATIWCFLLASPLLLPVSFAWIMHTVGVFGITARRNIPLNNRLERFDLLKSTDASRLQMRTSFEKPWVFWNTLRTLCSLATLVCLVFSLIYFRG